jgi:hypothetical protein
MVVGKIFTRGSYSRLLAKIKAITNILQTAARQIWDKRQDILDSRAVILGEFIFRALWICIKSAWSFSLFVTALFALAQGLILSIDKGSEARIMEMTTNVLIMGWNIFWTFILVGILMISTVAMIKFRNGIRRSKKEKKTLQDLESTINRINTRLSEIEDHLRMRS